MLLEEIKFKSKKLLFLNIFGENSTKDLGSGMEYEGSREYTTNDDIRHLNWRQMAKGSGATVKVYSEQKQLNIVLVYLISGSLNFGKPTKKDIAIESLTALSFASLKSQNRLNIIKISKDSHLYKSYPINSEVTNEIYKDLKNTLASGKVASSKDIIEYIEANIKSKSIIFFIGDFLEYLDISKLSYRHEIYAIILRDIAEEELEFSGEYNVLDSNSSNSKIINIDSKLKQEYKKHILQLDKSLKEQFTKHNIGFTKIYTNNNPIDKIARMLKYYE